MADTVSREKRSEIMSAVRSKDTKMEVSFRKALWVKGFRYRKNPKKYFGKPDLVLKKYKTVIFLDSCFWHGCPDHCRLPKTKKKYWQDKVKRNKLRDIEVSKHYINKDWKVFRIWEHEIKESENDVVEKLISFLEEQ